MAYVLIAVIVVAAAAYGYGQGWFANLNLPFSVSNNSGNSNLVDVNRAILFSLSDKYAGSALASKTLLLYNAAGAQVESLTPTSAAGTIATAHPYASGTQLYIKYVSSNTKQWFNIVVPQMQQSEMESSTYNPVALDSFTVGTGQVSLRSGGLAVTANYTDTTAGTTTTPTFTLDVTNIGADNTGMMESYNPVLGQNWQLWTVVTLSGGGQESIVYSGFDQSWQLGTTYYGATHLSADQFTLWKVGTTYQYGYQGDQTVSWSLDLTGATSNTVSMDIYVYAYCDAAYSQSHGGNLGTDKYQIATLSIDLSN